MAILEETEEGERRIPIPHTTSDALRGMWLAAVAITLFFAAIRGLARRKKGG